VVLLSPAARLSCTASTSDASQACIFETMSRLGDCRTHDADDAVLLGDYVVAVTARATVWSFSTVT
jgi:hypothetical protein